MLDLDVGQVANLRAIVNRAVRKRVTNPLQVDNLPHNADSRLHGAQGHYCHVVGLLRLAGERVGGCYYAVDHLLRG